MLKNTLLPVALLGLILPQLPCSALELHGAKGNALDFAGVLSAEPQGLKATVGEKGPPILITWNNLDLKWLAENNADIDAARAQAIKDKASVPLKLGVFKDIVTYEETVKKLQAMLDEKKSDKPSPVVNPSSHIEITFTMSGNQLVMKPTKPAASANAGGGGSGGRRGGGGAGGGGGGGGGSGGRRGGGGGGGQAGGNAGGNANGGPNSNGADNGFTLRAILNALSHKSTDANLQAGTMAFFKKNRSAITGFTDALTELRKTIPTIAFDPKNKDHVALLTNIDDCLTALNGYFNGDTVGASRKVAIEKFVDGL